jgi:hypothetical protein
MAEGISQIVASLEKQKQSIEKALAALRELDGTPAGMPRRGRPRGSGAAAPAAKQSRRGRISPEGRRRLAEAMRRRWAVKRAGSAVKKAAKKKAT